MSSEPKPVLVVLTPDEIARCRREAEIRSGSSEAVGIDNNRKDKTRSDFEIDFLGIRAEAAFGKAYGMPVRWDNTFPDQGWDFKVGDTTIDVKGTFRSDSSLWVRTKKGLTADIYVLVTATAREWRMQIVGGTSAKLLREKGERDKGSLILPQNRLHPPHALWRLFTRNQSKFDLVEWEARTINV